MAGVLLAAGRSRRMGRPKQLLPIDGITMIEAVITRVRPHVDHLVVVIGHAAEEVAPLLRPHGVRVAVNEEVDRGMLGSVKCGLRAAGTRCRGYLFCLGDQPGLTDSVVQAVLTAAASSEKGIVIPSYSGRRGHPVYLSRRYYHEILGLDERSGLNALTGSRPSDTLEVPVADPAVLEDVDTPADYARMLDAGAS
ncbi:MAG: nucleotidyltransferase family protein [Gemmatimonadaceae bacterium]|nr:nucleotidyltransferase family protein [Gemmatimonadaceae bacterium]